MIAGEALQLTAAYALDHLLGDPEGYPHPVRVMGRCIDLLEEKLNPEETGEMAALLAGCALAGMLVGGTWMSARLLLFLPARTLTGTLLLYTAFAGKDLKKSALRVAGDLEAADMSAARKHLVALVGRDPEDLDEAGICRAVVESVAENYTDAVLAPLVWAALGGAPAALAFKAVSTLDSMVGHRDARHRRLGWCSARLDDLAVMPAARLSIPLAAAAAGMCGYDHRAAMRIGMRDRKKHVSPNSAHAEAAFAGALGLKLGGPDTYAGVERLLPVIGEGTRDAEPRHIRHAVRLMNTASLLGLGLAVFCSSRPRRRNGKGAGGGERPRRRALRAPGGAGR